MATLYTDEDIAHTLQELRIEPVGGKINANEAARILTWRARAEQGIDYEYKPDALRSHVRYGNFEEGTVDPRARGSRYPVKQVFRLPLAPRRGTHQTQTLEKSQKM